MLRYDSTPCSYPQHLRPRSVILSPYVLSVRIVNRNPPVSLVSIQISTSTDRSQGAMCWFTLTPVKNKKRKRERERELSDCSYAEELVRVHHGPKSYFSDLRVKIPSSITVDLEHQHHHSQLRPFRRNHHTHPVHPLHLHPIHGFHQIHIHGNTPVDHCDSGHKWCSPPVSPPIPPPPSRDASEHRPRPRSRASPPVARTTREPSFQTRIFEPTTVRESTRVALRNVQSGRQQSRLRKVAGYEVLSREVPWQWDCVSNTSESSVADPKPRARRIRRAGLLYPPFSTLEAWL